MPEALQNPLVIAIVVLVLVLLIAIPVLIRRRRAVAEEVLPPPELGHQVDYTSLPYEEPTGLSDRFRRLSIGAKLLLFLVPLVLIVAIVIVAMLFQSSANPDIATQVAPAAKITDVKANVAGTNKILVQANTNLPNDATVTAALKENGQDFAWGNPATAPVRDGTVQITIEKLKDAPTPKEGQKYTVVLSAVSNDQTVSSEPADLEIPLPLKAAFYQIAGP